MSEPLRRLLKGFLSDVGEMADAMASGKVGGRPYGPREFQQDMARSLAEFHTAALMAGQGRDKLSANDLPRLRAIVGEQLDYLQKFVGQIELDGWKEAYRARAALYAGSIKHTYSVGATRGLDLPGYPAQGTDCRTNCGCRWEIQETQAEWLAYWRRGKNDSCPTCVDRASAWNPYRMVKV